MVGCAVYLTAPQDPQPRLRLLEVMAQDQAEPSLEQALRPRSGRSPAA